MKRRLAALTLATACALGAVACTDPNSPVGDHQPGWGEVREKKANSYGSGDDRIVFYYLRIATRYGTYWVEEDFEDWWGCYRGARWSRLLGCWGT